MGNNNNHLTKMEVAPPLNGRQLPLNGHHHAHLNGDRANGSWTDLPTASWVMNLGDGQLRFHGTAPGLATVPVSVHHETLAERLLELKADSGQFQFIEALPAPNGSLHYFLIVGFPIGVINGAKHPNLAGVAIDVTHQKLHMDQLEKQALGDALTKLYNLRGFTLFAEHELKVAHRRKTISAVVYVDVDGLKAVNDGRGHGEGDALLVATAKLLRNVFRECDVIGRLGGDEFAVFATDVRGDPEFLAKRLRAEIPVVGFLPGSPTGLAVSIGVAWCAPGAMPLAEMVAMADRAMYQDKAKKARRVSLTAAAAAIRAENR